MARKSMMRRIMEWQYPKKAKWDKAWSRKDEYDGFRHEYKEHYHTLNDNVLHGSPADDLARMVAIDHLEENPKYYQKLKKVGL